jgi:hypothetical protein
MTKFLTQKAVRNNHFRPVYRQTRFLFSSAGQKSDFIPTTGYRVAQVLIVFSHIAHHSEGLFPPGHYPPQHLAYLKWFSAFPAQLEASHLMYKLKRSLKDGEGLASIIPLDNICRSVHLLPKFGTVGPAHWTSSHVLKECSALYVNYFTDCMQLYFSHHE